MFEFGPIALRSVERDDLKKIHEWENDSEVMFYSRGRPHNIRSYDEVVKRYEEDLKNDRHLEYMVTQIDTNEAIGSAVIRLESWGGVNRGNIGTYLDRKYWNKGIGKLVTLSLLELAFYYLNLEKCDAWSIEYNKRAHKVLEACGFKQCGRERSSAFVLGKKWDWYCFDILREEYVSIRDSLLKNYLGDAYTNYIKRWKFTEF